VQQARGDDLVGVRVALQPPRPFFLAHTDHDFQPGTDAHTLANGEGLEDSGEDEVEV
jgi:hypothetical protein